MKTKKLGALTVVLIIFIQASFSQRELLIDSDDRLIFMNVNMDHDSNYVAIFNRDSADWNFKAGIVKFNDHLDYDMYVHENDSLYYEFWDFIVTDDNNYLITGTIGENIGLGKANHIIYFVLMDENLNIINENFYPLPEVYTSPFIKMFRNTNGKIYAILDRGDPSGVMKGFFELSPQGQILKEMMYYDMGSAILYPFPSQGNNFYLFRDTPVPWAPGGITEVDTSFNLISEYYFPMRINGIYYAMGTRGACKWLNDTAYILYSEGTRESATVDLYIYKLNQNHEFLTEPFIIGRDDFDDMALRSRGIDWIDPQNIWVAGTVWSSMYYPTPFYAAIINDDFELLGAKSCGGDNNTFIKSILATPDGGCIMVGGQRDYHAGNPYDTDGYIAFFKPEDIITTAIETPNPWDSDYQIFPNPGLNELNIQTARKGVELILFDQCGKVVLTQKLSDKVRNLIQTGLLNPGLYLCRLTDEYGYTEYKKWIKN